LAHPSTIAIDGPAASGKSTVGAWLAKRLGFVYLDTGVMYRAVTWAVTSKGVAVDDEKAVTALAQSLRIDILDPTVEDNRQYTILAGGQDVTWEIRRPEVVAAVSKVSEYAGVRQTLTEQQRRMAARGRIVMVGRDIGTVVLPGADLKIYLDATLEVRARRRHREMLARDPSATLEAALKSVHERDLVDSQRSEAPLKPAEDAIVIDTTELDIEQMLDRVLALVEGWRMADGG
jgi:cytidylate kinase